MKVDKYKIVEDSNCGYKRLDPIPEEHEIAEYYQNQYYKKIKEGGRAPELRRIMEGGKEASDERAWLHKTLYSDILHIIKEHQGNERRRVLDVGCGTGELIEYLKMKGLDAEGLDSSLEAEKIAKSRGLKVHTTPLEEFVSLAVPKKVTYDTILLMNLLEHVTNPEEILSHVKKILAPGGMVCIRVPNDFSDLQLMAQKKLELDPWWVAVPDHIHYFDFESLGNLMAKNGFDIVYSQGDFPMELFLLMGENYVTDSESGKRCHQKRMSFEMAVDEVFRRRLYESWAKQGIGRTCLMVGKIKG